MVENVLIWKFLKGGMRSLRCVHIRCLCVGGGGTEREGERSWSNFIYPWDHTSSLSLKFSLETSCNKLRMRTPAPGRVFKILITGRTQRNSNRQGRGSSGEIKHTAENCVNSGLGVQFYKDVYCSCFFCFKLGWRVTANLLREEEKRCKKCSSSDVQAKFCGASILLLNPFSESFWVQSILLICVNVYDYL